MSFYGAPRLRISTCISWPRIQACCVRAVFSCLGDWMRGWGESPCVYCTRSAFSDSAACLPEPTALALHRSLRRTVHVALALVGTGIAELALMEHGKANGHYGPALEEVAVLGGEDHSSTNTGSTVDAKAQLANEAAVFMDSVATFRQRWGQWLGEVGFFLVCGQNGQLQDGSWHGLPAAGLRLAGATHWQRGSHRRCWT